MEQESEPEFLKINVFWGKKVCNCGVKCNFQNLLLGTKSDFQNSNLNFIGKKSDPRVPLSCGTGTRTILNLFLIKWKMEVHKNYVQPINAITCLTCRIKFLLFFQ